MNRLALVCAFASALGQSTPTFATGALALGSCDPDGYAYGYYTGGAPVPEAQQQALAGCPGGGCRIIQSIEDGSCMALSVDRAVACGAEGSGYAPTISRAEWAAVDACRHYGGGNCQVIFSKCDEVIVTPDGGRPVPSLVDRAWYKSMCERSKQAPGNTGGEYCNR